MGWLDLLRLTIWRAVPKEHSLGLFGILPQEIRVKIFKATLSESFDQVYKIEDGELVYDRELSPPRPSLLRTSKQLRQDMFLTGATGGICTIIVDTTTIHAEFLSCLVVLEGSTEAFPTFQLPACKLLKIYIAPPQSSNAWDVLKTRRTVQQLTRILSHAKFDHVKNISVELGRTRGSCFQCPPVNYFDLLATPFLYLRKHGQRFSIVRPEACTHAVEIKCWAIESAFEGNWGLFNSLTFEQLLTDIKLPLCLWENWFKQFPRNPYESAPVELDYATANEVFIACDRFLAWFAKDKDRQPDWLGRLSDIVRRQRMVPMNLLDMILGDEHHLVRRHDTLAYILGFHIANPFY